MIEYKVLREYNRFYLCEHPKGYKECFLKSENTPVNGHITLEQIINKEITIDSYVLTNVNLENGYFTIRLKDEKEYIVYREKGNKYFIIKDNQKILLNDEVRKVHLEAVREYQVSGI